MTKTTLTKLTKLTKTQHKLLTAITARHNSFQKLVSRAAIILEYDKSDNKDTTATNCCVTRDTVYRWINRFTAAQEELDQLELEYQAGCLSDARYERAIGAILYDAPRSGHPATFTEEQKQKIIALAAEKPETVGVPITHWTHKLLQDTIIDRGIVPTISSSQVGRFLKQSHLAAAPG